MQSKHDDKKLQNMQEAKLALQNNKRHFSADFDWNE